MTVVPLPPFADQQRNMTDHQGESRPPIPTTRGHANRRGGCEEEPPLQREVALLIWVAGLTNLEHHAVASGQFATKMEEARRCPTSSVQPLTYSELLTNKLKP